MKRSKINAISNSEFQRRMSSNENEGHSPRRGREFVPKKKILAERNSNGDAPLADTRSELEVVKPIICSSEYVPLSSRVLRSSDPNPPPPPPYDPVNNLTSPRPKFLRYNPNRRIGMVPVKKTWRDGEGSPDRGQGKEEVASLLESFASSDEENFQQVEEDDPGVEEKRRWGSRMVWKLLFLFGLFLFSRHYLFPMPPPPPPPPLQDSCEGSTPPPPLQGGTRNLLITHIHMGLSDMCLDVQGSMMCAIDEEDRTSFLVLDDFSEEAHDVIGEQVVNNDLVTSDEVTATLNSEEEEDLYYGIRDTEERDGEKLTQDTEHLYSEDEHDVQREESGAEAMVVDTYNDIHLEDEHIVQPSEAAIYSGDKIEAEASLSAPLSSALALFPLVDQGSDQLEWARHLAILVARARPFCVPMNLLAAALFGVSLCIFRHVLNLKASSSPKPLPRSKSLGKKRYIVSVAVGSDEKRFKPAVIEEEFRDQGKDSRLRHLPSNHLTYESGASYATTRPPTVQLLGEFSFTEPTVSKIGAGQSSKRTEPPEESQLPQYQSKKPSEDSQISRYHARKNVSSSASKVHPSTASTTADGSHTTLEKLPRTEDTGTRREVKILATPLRRSDRLRNRVTSP